jgi:hypothetical protein
MSLYRFREWSKQNQRIKEELANAPTVWDQSPEELIRKTKQIKQQWRKEEELKFQEITKEETQNRYIKNILHTLISITILASIITTIPGLLRLGQQKMTEWLPTEETKTNTENKPTLLEGENSATTGNKPTLKERLDESFSNMNEHNEKLQKAIDMTEGKDVTLGDDQNKNKNKIRSN